MRSVPLEERSRVVATCLKQGATGVSQEFSSLLSQLVMSSRALGEQDAYSPRHRSTRPSLLPLMRSFLSMQHFRASRSPLCSLFSERWWNPPSWRSWSSGEQGHSFVERVLNDCILDQCRRNRWFLPHWCYQSTDWQHTEVYVSIRTHTLAYVSIRQHT
jgi:hypothetical protein